MVLVWPIQIQKLLSCQPSIQLKLAFNASYGLSVDIFLYMAPWKVENNYTYGITMLAALTSILKICVFRIITKGGCLHLSIHKYPWQLVITPAVTPGHRSPYNKVHGVNMGSTWVLSAPDGPHVGPMNLAFRVITTQGSQWCMEVSGGPLNYYDNCLKA